MTSSPYYELAIIPSSGAALNVAMQPVQIPLRITEKFALVHGRPVELRVQRQPGRPAARIRLESDIIGHLAAGTPALRLQLDMCLNEEFGEARLLLEESALEGEQWALILEVPLHVQGSPELEALHSALVEELAQIQASLVEDMLGRTWHRRGSSAGRARALRPEEELQALTGIYQDLARAVERIGRQPSTSLRRERLRVAWRPGDRLDTQIAAELATRPGTRLSAAGRVLAIGSVVQRRVQLTQDLAEHRHLREGIRRLATRGAALSSYCSRAAGLLAEEGGRWSAELFDRLYLPRIRRLEELSAQAETLSRTAHALIARHAFLREAGPPRTPFGPTPAFLGRNSYREAYRALRRLRRHGGQLVEGADMSVRYKSLSLLFEYWCYVRVVRCLQERLGGGETHDVFRLIDDIYRPELAPGQSFTFSPAPDCTVTAIYQPEFPPVSDAPGPSLRASLVSGVLRPDMVIRVDAGGRPPVMLALDAKSTAGFDRSRLWNISDYRSLVHDPATGHQPIRQLFLIHRDTSSAALCNLAGYLEGRISPPDSASILGAIPCVPGHTHDLERVIRRFLAHTHVSDTPI